MAMRNLPTTQQYPFDEEQIISRDPRQLVEYLKRLIKQEKAIYEGIARIVNVNAKEFNNSGMSDVITLVNNFMQSGRSVWIHEDVAPTGWSIKMSCADTLLAVKGGTNAYNVSGGGVGGTWTQPNHHHSTGDHTLTSDEMPSHTHAQNAHNHVVNDPTHNHASWAGRSSVAGTETGDGFQIGYQRDTSYSATGIYLSSATATNLNTGGGAAHNHGNTGNSATESAYRPMASVGIVVEKD